MSDSYRTLSGESEGLYKEKGSKFIAYAFPVETLEEVEGHLEALRKKHYDSRHVCFAYRLGPEGEEARAYDAGEPAHSAGDPILNEMRSQELTNALVVVVRYFGGTKLGIPGLIEAYKLATRDVVANGKIREVVQTEPVTIQFPYELTSEVNRAMHHHGLVPAHAVYGADTLLRFEIPLSRHEQIREMFEEMGILKDETEF